MAIEKRKFTNDEIMYWRDLLMQRKERFLDARDLLKTHALKDLSAGEVGEISSLRLHPADLATQTQEVTTLDTLLEKNLRITQEIESALDRLEAGTYGVCLSCGDAIARSRLETIPETRYCFNCQLDEEEARRLAEAQKQKRPEAYNSILVSEVMQEHPITVRANESIEVAMQLMSDNNIRHLPVIDNRGDIQGIISDRDLLGIAVKIRPKTLAQEGEDLWGRRKLESIMTKTPETIAPDASLAEAGAVLLENGISCLPVVDGNRLVGIITERDFVKLVAT